MLVPSPADLVHVSTDLARYSPGQIVHLSVVGPRTKGRIVLRVYQGVDEVPNAISPTTWSGAAKVDWRPPATDGRGYLVVAEVRVGPKTVARGSCGVDVSSTWTRFPRYGYLAHFGPELKDQAPSILDALNDYHIDALQFYDWQWRHHRPLSPTPLWLDIANRLTSADTVRAYIAASHRKNIACMAYNLGYGAVDGYQDDGVSQSWALYDDPGATKPYKLTLPSGWATTGLYLQDAGNAGWQSYIIRRENEALRAFGFDGWHMDQLGDPGTKFTSGGKPVELKSGFESLLDRVKRQIPGPLIFNDVGGYGLEETRRSKVDAMYVEPWEWSGQRTYNDLRNTIDAMRATGKEAILAAYVDYDLAKSKPGTAFNEPGVMLANATILASGGSHLELGDNLAMLCHEYFPNHDLTPSTRLLARLRTVYDFIVGYENLLRGATRPSAQGVVLDQLPCSDSGEKGTVWAIVRKSGARTIVNLVNLLSVDDVEWRDRNGTRPAPRVLTNVHLRLPGLKVGKVFVASPDDGLGTPIAAKVVDGTIVVPRLEYWTMIVVEG